MKNNADVEESERVFR